MVLRGLFQLIELCFKNRLSLLVSGVIGKKNNFKTHDSVSFQATWTSAIFLILIDKLVYTFCIRCLIFLIFIYFLLIYNRSIHSKLICRRLHPWFRSNRFWTENISLSNFQDSVREIGPNLPNELGWPTLSVAFRFHILIAVQGTVFWPWPVTTVGLRRKFVSRPNCCFLKFKMLLFEVRALLLCSGSFGLNNRWCWCLWNASLSKRPRFLEPGPSGNIVM